jgi:hypothetical protein
MGFRIGHAILTSFDRYWYLWLKKNHVKALQVFTMSMNSWKFVTCINHCMTQKALETIQHMVYDMDKHTKCNEFQRLIVPMTRQVKWHSRWIGEVTLWFCSGVTGNFPWSKLEKKSLHAQEWAWSYSIHSAHQLSHQVGYPMEWVVCHSWVCTDSCMPIWQVFKLC